jgi:hypothetical protein
MLLERGRGHALAEQAVAQPPRIVRQQQLAGVRIEERAMMPRAVLLIAVFLQKRAAKRAGMRSRQDGERGEPFWSKA